MENHSVLFNELQKYFGKLDTTRLSEERKAILKPLVKYIKNKASANHTIRLNFICTHNSRRSHFAQIWAQTAAAYFNIQNIECFSGGTEATALFPMVISTLENVGFKISKENEASNPVYKISYSESLPAILGFSKKYDDESNPQSGFAAIMTCSEVDQGCPFVSGSEKRIPVTYEDPKISDGTPLQKQIYLERSEQIATEMKYVFESLASK